MAPTTHLWTKHNIVAMSYRLEVMILLIRHGSRPVFQSRMDPSLLKKHRWLVCYESLPIFYIESYRPAYILKINKSHPEC